MHHINNIIKCNISGVLYMCKYIIHNNIYFNNRSMSLSIHIWMITRFSPPDKKIHLRETTVLCVSID